MKNTFRKLIFIAALLFEFGIVFTCTVFAANVCRQISSTSANATESAVNTGSGPYHKTDVIQFTQTKSTMETEIVKPAEKADETRTMYENRNYDTKNMSDSNAVNARPAKWTSRSMEIKLDKHTMYQTSDNLYTADIQYEFTYEYTPGS